MARILVIDDDKLFSALMRRALENRGHYVAVSGDAKDGRESLEREEFDAVVCDIILPGESGLSVLRDLRTNPHMALLAISGGKGSGRGQGLDVLQLAQTLNIDAIVRKPFELSAFVATVEGAIAKKRHSTAAASA